MRVEVRRGNRLFVDGVEVGTAEFSGRVGRGIARFTHQGRLWRVRRDGEDVLLSPEDNRETVLARRRAIWGEAWETTDPTPYQVRSRDWFSLSKPIVTQDGERVGRAGVEFWRGRRFYAGRPVALEDAFLLLYLGATAHTAPRWWDFTV